MALRSPYRAHFYSFSIYDNGYRGANDGPQTSVLPGLLSFPFTSGAAAATQSSPF